eukprot:UN0155
MRWGLVALFHDAIHESLAKELLAPVLRPLPVAREVCQRFMRAVESHASDPVCPAYHGSSAKNYPSICKRGLLIPGDGNELSIVHGNAHGRGVYTANVDSAWLSASFIDQPHMLVCAVLDSSCVRHVGDAMVVGNSAHVVPIFEAYSTAFANGCRGKAAPAPPMAAQLTSSVGKSSALAGASVVGAAKPSPTTKAMASRKSEAAADEQKAPPKAPKKKTFVQLLAARSQKRR